MFCNWTSWFVGIWRRIRSFIAWSWMFSGGFGAWPKNRRDQIVIIIIIIIIIIIVVVVVVFMRIVVAFARTRSSAAASWRRRVAFASRGVVAIATHTLLAWRTLLIHRRTFARLYHCPRRIISIIIIIVIVIIVVVFAIGVFASSTFVLFFGVLICTWFTMNTFNLRKKQKQTKKKKNKQTNKQTNKHTTVWERKISFWKFRFRFFELRKKYHIVGLLSMRHDAITDVNRWRGASGFGVDGAPTLLLADAERHAERCVVRVWLRLRRVVYHYKRIVAVAWCVRFACGFRIFVFATQVSLLLWQLHS